MRILDRGDEGHNSETLQTGVRSADEGCVNVDPFDLLGVNRDATDAEINAAYRRLAPVFDPRRWCDDSPEVLAQARAWSETLVRAREAAMDVVLWGSVAMPGAPNRPGRLLVAVAGPIP